LKELYRVTQEFIWLVVLFGLLFGGLAVGIDLVRTPMYEASATVVVGQKEGSSDFDKSLQDRSLQSSVLGLQQITQTMAELIPTRPVTQAVTEQLNLQDTPPNFEGKLTAQQVRSTELIAIKYRDADPERAQQVTNAIAYEFPTQISEESPWGDIVTIEVWEEATLPNEPVSPHVVRDGLVALTAGVVTAGTLIFLLWYLRERARSRENTALTKTIDPPKITEE